MRKRLVAFRSGTPKLILQRSLLLVGLLGLVSVGSCVHKQRKPAATTLEPGPRTPRSYSVDSSVKPCEDFYTHVCGPTVREFKLPEHRTHFFFAFDDNREHLVQVRTSFLKRLTQQEQLPQRAQQLSDFFKACLNESARASDERQILAEVVKELSGLTDRAHLLSFLAEKITLGDSVVFGIEDAVNAKDPNLRDLSFYFGGLAFFHPAHYQKPALLKDYQGLMVRIFEKFGLQDPVSRSARVLELEKKLAHHYPTPERLKEERKKATTISLQEFTSLYPYLPIQGILASVPKTIQVRHPVPELLKEINQKLETEPVEVLKDYYLIRKSFSVIEVSDPEFNLARRQMMNAHLGYPAAQANREQECTRQTMAAFEMELDHALLPEYFPRMDEAELRRLVEKIRNAVIEGLSRNTWLKDSKTEAIAKMKAAELNVFKPMHEIDWNFLPLKMYNPTRPMLNWHILAQAKAEKVLGVLKENNRRTQWYVGPLSVNAFYEWRTNSFFLPAGIFQHPFYYEGISEEELLGGLGSIIGHELGHGLDDIGYAADRYGRLSDWMGDEQRAEFKKRGDQLIEIFNRAGANGLLTRGENISDLVGISFALAAAGLNSPEASAESLKRFFYSWGRNWCYVIRDNFREERKRTNPHALGDLRVNEQMKLQPAFSKAFQCKKGDAMWSDSNSRITIW